VALSSRSVSFAAAPAGTQKAEPGKHARPILGRVATKCLADELYDKGHLIVDGTDGKAHCVALPPRTELEQYPRGAVVEMKGARENARTGSGLSL
jgi:type IV secretory pathway VirD2 relaxase